MRQPFTTQHLIEVSALDAQAVTLEDLIDQPVLFDADVLVTTDEDATVGLVFVTDYGASADADWNGSTEYGVLSGQLVEGGESLRAPVGPFLRTYDAVDHPFKHVLTLMAGGTDCKVRIFIRGTAEASYHHTPATRTV